MQPNLLYWGQTAATGRGEERGGQEGRRSVENTPRREDVLTRKKVRPETVMKRDFCVCPRRERERERRGDAG